MALSVKSFSTTALGNISGTPWPIVLTKPTGTVDGDLLIAIVGEQGTTMTAPTGWSLVIREPTGSYGDNLYVWSKVASGEPSSWTFNGTGNFFGGGAVLRMEGYDTGTPLDTSAGAGSSGTSLSFANTITPGRGNNLELFVVFAYKANNSLTDINSYAITNNNPTWTEIFDLNQNGGGTSFELTCATATRPQTTATGNSTATANSSTDDAAGVIISINRATAYIIPTVVDSTALSDLIKRGPSRILRDSITMSDTIATSFMTLWTNLQKSAANTWNNLTKS